jgi:hypothetical protein
MVNEAGRDDPTGGLNDFHFREIARDIHPRSNSDDLLPDDEDILLSYIVR